MVLPVGERPFRGLITGPRVNLSLLRAALGDSRCGDRETSGAASIVAGLKLAFLFASGLVCVPAWLTLFT